MTTTWTETQARIVREASQLQPVKVLITILAFPFFLIGLTIGLVWTLGALIWQSVWVGVVQARQQLKRN